MVTSMLAMLGLVVLPSVGTGASGLVAVGDGADRFGYQVEAGDLDDDGTIDLVVAAPHPIGGNVVYVFFGQHDLLGQQLDPANADVVIQGPAEAETGWSIAVGDVSGTKEMDLVIGSPNESNGGGVVHVFEGPLTPAMFSTADATTSIRGGSVGGFFGWSVTTGDFDGDGVGELGVGACGESSGGLGRAYLFDLGTSPSDTGDATTVFEGAGQTGCSIANAGDFNSDGYEELLVGSPGSSLLSGHVFGGAVSLVYGRPAFLSSYDLPFGDPLVDDIAHLVAEGKGETFGEGIAAAGDVNEDGYDDFVVGAPAYTCNGTPAQCSGRDREGAAYVILGVPDTAPGGGEGRGLHGNSRGSDVADVIWDAGVQDDRTGISVAGAGYVGNTYSTWNVAAGPVPLASRGPVLLFGTSADTAYVIPYDLKHRIGVAPQYKCVLNGDGELSCTIDRTDVPPSRKIRRDLNGMTKGGHRFVGDPGSAFGLDVLGPGDLDGDGTRDLLFGAPAQVDYDDAAGDGEAFAYRGL